MKILPSLLCAGACVFSASAFAASYKVEIQNLTQGFILHPYWWQPITAKLLYFKPVCLLRLIYKNWPKGRTTADL